MHKHLRLLAGTALLAALMVAGAALASEKIGKSTGKDCTYCHDKPGSKLLTDRGMYYQTVSSLEGFDAVQATFGKCTTCHVRRPGSHKLTKKGRALADLAHDMGGLQKWVKDGHPVPASN